MRCACFLSQLEDLCICPVTQVGKRVFSERIIAMQSALSSGHSSPRRCPRQEAGPWGPAFVKWFSRGFLSNALKLGSNAFALNSASQGDRFALC